MIGPEKNNPLVSIIIPVYNRAHTMAQCLQSCLDQTYTNLEILVVDDCSTDNSVGLIRDFMKRDQRIKLFSNPKNMKLGYTRNIGLREMNGELVTFLDSDDIFLPEKIHRCVEAYQSTQADCINSPVISRFHNRKDEISVIKKTDNLLKDYLSRAIVWKIIGPVWTKKCIDEIGWFITGTEIFGSEDFEFHTRAILRRRNFCFLSEPLSVQINLDPELDKVKIRNPANFEMMAKIKLFSRAIVLKNIFKSDIGSLNKFKTSALILKYVLSILKNCFKKVSVRKTFTLKSYFLNTLLFRKIQPGQ